MCAQVDGDGPEAGVADHLEVAERVERAPQPSDGVGVLVDDEDLEGFGHWESPSSAYRRYRAAVTIQPAATQPSRWSGSLILNQSAL